MSAAWEVVIGLEVHVQLKTNSKIFSAASTAYGAEPNCQASAIDLGMPGVLPVLNEEAVRMACQFGLAIDAEIAPQSIFARKHYFYPDSPKGYQISQYELPIVGIGQLEITLEDGSTRSIGVTRAHLEEDAGKSVHEGFEGASGIDLNRCGTPLIEVVSEPEMRSAKEAVAYLKKLHSLVTYIGICDGNMQEGSFRCDANVSVRPRGTTELGTRTETKNLNSFRFVEKAINYEIERQIDVIESGGAVVQETRLFNTATGETRTMRSKEEANDYRYFPDPDLLPVAIDNDMLVTLRSALPELPDAKRSRFIEQYALSAEDADQLTASRAVADFYEALAADVTDTKQAANWVNGALSACLNRDALEISASPVSAASLAALLKRIEDKTISGKIAKEVFEAMWAEGAEADAIIEAKGLKQITDSAAIEPIIDEIITANPGQVEQFRAGKEKLMGFFVGQVMKATQGKASPAEVNRLLQTKLKG